MLQSRADGCSIRAHNIHPSCATRRNAQLLKHISRPVSVYKRLHWISFVCTCNGVTPIRVQYHRDRGKFGPKVLTENNNVKNNSHKLLAETFRISLR